MKRFLEIITACILVVIGVIPQKIIRSWYIFIASAWTISMLVYMIMYFDIETEVFSILQVLFGISTIIFAIWKFTRSDLWFDYTDCLDRLSGAE